MDLVVSTGAAVMPRVVGLQTAPAVELLASRGLHVSISPDGCEAPGRVISQSPEQGAVLPLGTLAHITVLCPPGGLR